MANLKARFTEFFKSQLLREILDFFCIHSARVEPLIDMAHPLTNLNLFPSLLTFFLNLILGFYLAIPQKRAQGGLQQW